MPQQEQENGARRRKRERALDLGRPSWPWFDAALRREIEQRLEDAHPFVVSSAAAPRFGSWRPRELGAFASALVDAAGLRAELSQDEGVALERAVVRAIGWSAPGLLRSTRYSARWATDDRPGSHPRMIALERVVHQLCAGEVADEAWMGDHATVKCPTCGGLGPGWIPALVNLDRNVSARRRLLEGSLLVPACARCGHAFELDSRCLCLSFDRGLFLLLLPRAEQARFIEHERELAELYARGLGPGTPDPSAAVLGADMRVRLCFGELALREKLLCDEHAVDDDALEGVKFDLFRAGLPWPSLDTSLRLARVCDEDLVLCWEGDPNEAEVVRVPLAQLVPRVRAGKDGPLARWLSAGAFVDLGRLLRVPPRELWADPSHGLE